MKITLIAATLNEIEAIPHVLPNIPRNLIDEIIVVDGGSTDGTIEYCQTQDYRLLHQTGRGYGEGIREAVNAATGDIIIEFPPDGNSMVERLPDLVKKIKSGFDFVIVSRYKDGAKSDDDDIMTAFGNWMFTFLTNLLFKTSYTDVLVGYRGYFKKSFMTLGLNSKGLSWPLQEAIRFATHGYKVGEIGGDEPPRLGGVRKMRIFKTGWEILILLIREWRQHVRSKL